MRGISRRKFAKIAAIGTASLALPTLGGCGTSESHGGVSAGTGTAGEDPARLRVFDLHCDTLDRLALHDFEMPHGYAEDDAHFPADRMSSLADNDTSVSLDRMQAFDWCQCFAIWIPDELRGDEAWSVFRSVQSFWEDELQRQSGRLMCARTMADVAAAHGAGKTAGFLTAECASFLEDDGTAESRLYALVKAGVHMVTLTWNGRNALGSGNDTDEGLTAFGRTCIREFEQRGIIVDVSHLNDAGFRDACEVATRPFAASHSDSREVCSHPRNLADWQLREIADRDGVVGLNYYRAFLSSTNADPTPDDLLRHVERILKVGGENVLVLGSDYDGGDAPSWLESCDRVGDLHGLISGQFGQEVANKVFFDNAQAFFARMEK